MGCYVILLTGLVALFMVNVEANGGFGGAYLGCPDCFCALEAKVKDKEFNAAFLPWFQSVFRKELFTCPKTTYNYRRCECAEVRTIIKCSLTVYRIKAVTGEKVSVFNFYPSLVTVFVNVINQFTILTRGGIDYQKYFVLKQDYTLHPDQIVFRAVLGKMFRCLSFCMFELNVTFIHLRSYRHGAYL